MTDAATAVIAAAGESRAAVLGISMGGLIAQELALECPDVVASLILVATSAGRPHITGDPEAMAAIMAAASLPADERVALLSPFTYARSTPPELMTEDEAVRASQPTREAAYRGQLAAIGNWSRLDDLKRITCPTLVLHGEQDRLISVTSAQLLADAIPGAELTVLPHAAHQLFTDQLDVGAKTVMEFLQRSTTC